MSFSIRFRLAQIFGQLVGRPPHLDARRLQRLAQAELRPRYVQGGDDAAAKVTYGRRRAHQPGLELAVDGRVAQLVSRRAGVGIEHQGPARRRAVDWNPVSAPVACLHEPGRALGEQGQYLVTLEDRQVGGLAELVYEAAEIGGRQGQESAAAGTRGERVELPPQ